MWIKFGSIHIYPFIYKDLPGFKNLAGLSSLPSAIIVSRRVRGRQTRGCYDWNTLYLPAGGGGNGNN